MNGDSYNDIPRDDHDEALPPDLHARLAALRQDVAPRRDLWPAIATRLARPRMQARGYDATTESSADAIVSSTAAPVAVTTARTRPGTARTGARHRSPVRLMPYAVAASLLVAVAFGWQLAAPRSTGTATPAIANAPSQSVPSQSVPSQSMSTQSMPTQDAPLLRVADAMTREYMGAQRELDAARATALAPAASIGALAELDRSAGEVRAALEHDPDAVFLVQRLQRIYARRLALARRLA